MPIQSRRKRELFNKLARQRGKSADTGLYLEGFYGGDPPIVGNTFIYLFGKLREKGKKKNRKSEVGKVSAGSG